MTPISQILGRSDLMFCSPPWNIESWFLYKGCFLFIYSNASFMSSSSLITWLSMWSQLITQLEDWSSSRGQLMVPNIIKTAISPCKLRILKVYFTCFFSKWRPIVSLSVSTHLAAMKESMTSQTNILVSVGRQNVNYFFSPAKNWNPGLWEFHVQEGVRKWSKHVPISSPWSSLPYGFCLARKNQLRALK